MPHLGPPRDPPVSFFIHVARGGSGVGSVAQDSAGAGEVCRRNLFRNGRVFFFPCCAGMIIAVAMARCPFVMWRRLMLAVRT
jgi:hypothetical protein